MKKIIPLLITILFIAGCSPAAVNTVPSASIAASTALSSPSPIASPTEAPTAAPSPSPNLTETPSPTFTEVNVNTLEVEGCTKEVKDGKILFYAEEGNPYGLDAGELFGEFVENVNIITGGGNGTDEVVNNTGGWALNSKAVHVLFEQASAEAGEDSTKTKVVLPVDISGFNKGDEVNISQLLKASIHGVSEESGPMLMVKFGESVLNICDGYDSGSEGLSCTTTRNSFTLNLFSENGDVLTLENTEVYCYGGVASYYSSNFNDVFAGEAVLGDRFATVKSDLAIYNSLTKSLFLSDILTFQNAPVFLMGNKSN